MKKTFFAGIAVGLAAAAVLKCKRDAVLFFKTVKCGSEDIKDCACDEKE